MRCENFSINPRNGVGHTLGLEYERGRFEQKLSFLVFGSPAIEESEIDKLLR